MLGPIGIAAAALCLQVPPPDAALRPTEGLLAEREAIRSREAQALSAIAVRLADAGKADEAAEVRARIDPRPTADGPLRFRPRPELVAARGDGLANIPPTPPDVQGPRDEAARAFFELARKAANPRVGRYSLADACLRETLARQPDHAEARRLLGFVPQDGGWATPDAAEQLRRGKVLHPKFGWVPSDWVPHLDRGELPGTHFVGERPTQWLPADEADALRNDFDRRPWQITTAHFEIRTNVPLSEAITFGRRLEDFHDLFFSLLADVVGRERLPLAQRFANPKLKPAKSTRRHQVWFFASKSEYIDHLRTIVGPGVELELGRYQPSERRSYFYRDADGQIESTATLYHEVSHQVLFESAGKSGYERNTGNYWVWEGLGTYFETLVPRSDGTLEVGGQVGPRIEQARIRALDKGQFLALAEFVAMDRSRFNDDQAVYLHYTQAMALAVFLMQAENGRFREPFLDYVRDAYEGRVRAGANSLESHLGVPLEKVERDLFAFLKAGRESG